MQNDREELRDRFERLTDTELIRSFESDGLTTLAREVAGAELRRRGLAAIRPSARASSYDDESEADAADNLLELARVLTTVEAYILQGLLQAEGIPAVVADAGIVQANYLLTLAVGGVRVLVPASQLAASREIKLALERGDYALEEDDGDDTGDAP